MIEVLNDVPLTLIVATNVLSVFVISLIFIDVFMKSEKTLFLKRFTLFLILIV